MKCFVISDTFTKILVATGASLGDTRVEIIDLSDENLICQPLTNFPRDVQRAGEMPRQNTEHVHHEPFLLSFFQNCINKDYILTVSSPNQELFMLFCRNLLNGNCGIRHFGMLNFFDSLNNRG